MLGLTGALFGADPRICETVALWPRDYETSAGTSRIRLGKGDEWRTWRSNLSPLVDVMAARRGQGGQTAAYGE
jgi:hypothetical protein